MLCIGLSKIAKSIKILQWYTQCSFIPSESKMAIKIIKTKPKSNTLAKFGVRYVRIQSSSLRTVIGWEMCAYCFKNSETHQNNDKN